MGEVYEAKCDSSYLRVPIPVDAWSKVWVFSRSLAGIAGSYPAGSMDVCFLRVCVLSGRDVRDGPIIRSEEP
jgi:hypothetical protein